MKDKDEKKLEDVDLLPQARWCPTHSLAESNWLKSTPTPGAGAGSPESD